jgi:hypothetical protein
MTSEKEITDMLLQILNSDNPTLILAATETIVALHDRLKPNDSDREAENPKQYSLGIHFCL